MGEIETSMDSIRVDDCSGLVPFAGCLRRSAALTAGDSPRRCMVDIPLLRKLKQFMLLIECVENGTDTPDAIFFVAG